MGRELWQRTRLSIGAEDFPSRAIKSIMRRESPPRTIEDIDSMTMSAGEAKAVASGNPDVLKAVTLKNTINKLQMLKASDLDAKVRAREQLRVLPIQITNFKENINKMEKDAAHVGKTPDKFSIVVGGKQFDKRDDAGQRLIETLNGIEQDGSKADIAQYRDFQLSGKHGLEGYYLTIAHPATSYNYQTSVLPFVVDKDGKRKVSSEISPSGILQRVDLKLAAIPKTLEQAKHDLTQAEANKRTYQEQQDKPFEQQERLAKMEAELERIEQKLQGKQVSEEPITEDISAEEIGGKPAEYHFAAKEPEIGEAPKAEVGEMKAVEKQAENIIETAEVIPTPANVKPLVESELPIPKDMPKKVTPAPEVTRGEVYDKQFAEAMTQNAKREKEYANLTERHAVERDAIKNRPRTERLELAAKQQEEIEAFRAESTLLKGVTPPVTEAGTPDAEETEEQLRERILKEQFPKRKIQETTKPKKESKPKIDKKVRQVEAKVKAAKPQHEIKKLSKEGKKLTKRLAKPHIPTKKSLRLAHSMRTPQARALDESRAHSLTIEPSSPKVKLWMRNQGLADIRGIDTLRLRTPKLPQPPRQRTPKTRPTQRISQGMYLTKSGGFTRRPKGRLVYRVRRR